MKKPNQNPTTIEATLDDLYANELNVESSWDHKRGFLAVLGNPPLAKKTFPTSGKAVSWLKEQAVRHFTRAEFPAKGPGAAGRETILDQLRESHITGSISWVWDGGFYATIGEPKRAEKYSAASAGEAIEWPRDQAILHYPDSEFAHQYAGFGVWAGLIALVHAAGVRA